MCVLLSHHLQSDSFISFMNVDSSTSATFCLTTTLPLPFQGLSSLNMITLTVSHYFKTGIRRAFSRGRFVL